MFQGNAACGQTGTILLHIHAGTYTDCSSHISLLFLLLDSLKSPNYYQVTLFKERIYRGLGQALKAVISVVSGNL